MAGDAVHDLTVGQVSGRSAVAVSALHYYERQGLIFSTRNSANQRRYDRGTLRRLAFIRASQGVGISLTQIRAALDGLPHGRSPTPKTGQNCRVPGAPTSMHLSHNYRRYATTSPNASAAAACHYEHAT